MRITKQKIDPSIITNRTYSVKERIKNIITLAEKFREDPMKKERHKKQECPVCFYADSRVGGATMCSVECALCEEVIQFCNTCTDILCKECAKKAGLCCHCGADIDVKNRRKFNL